MAAGATYTQIATNTLGSAASSVTFSSIPGTYTDLIIASSIISNSTSNDTKVQFNGDTNSNYSMTRMYGEASATGSDRSTNATSMHLGRNSTTVTPNIFHIMNYSNTTTYKTALGRSGFATGIVLANVGLWRSTSAITSVTILITGGDTFSANSTFSLYGIAAA
jgi:hypothetical protein